MLYIVVVKGKHSSATTDKLCSWSHSPHVGPARERRRITPSLKAVVGGPAGPAMAGPLFLLSL